MNFFETDQNDVEKIEGMTVEFPYCMHERDMTGFSVPWHWHEELELGYIEEGTSKIVTLNGEYTVHQGDGFFVNGNVMKRKENALDRQKTLEINHIFHPVFLSGHFKSLFETKYINPIITNRQLEVHVIRRGNTISNQIIKNLEHLREVNSQKNCEFIIRNILSETWLLLMEEIQNNYKPAFSNGSEQQDRLRGMIAYIHKNYADKITLSQLSEVVGISTREATRIFQKAVHQSPIDYLIQYRLNEAKKLLSQTDLSVTEISYQCGFSDSAYLGKAFKKEFKQTPREYRNATR